MKPGLSPRVAQRLSLTPQLTLSLNILGMNVLDLDAFLAQSLEQNPLLEGEQTAEPEPLPDMDSLIDQADPWWPTPGMDEVRDGESQLRAAPTLCEWLHAQLARQPMPERERRLAMAIVDSLDDDGLFRADLAAFAEEYEVAPEFLEHVLTQRVQALEPTGIAARDTLECLLLQLDEARPEERLARTLLLDHQHMLGDREALQRALRVEPALLDAALARLRRLDPFPGHRAADRQPIYIAPDLRIRRAAAETFEVELIERMRVQVSRQWRHVRWSEAERAFMQQARREANWIVQALRQRRDTLLRIGQCLASRQAAMLASGFPAIQPLTLKDVAQELGMHESTVSRAVQGKYADTPIGVLPLKSFFSAGLRTRVGGTISTSRVRQRIKALIEAEDKTRPISDQRIAEALCREGIEIARRTVAKYREQLGLPTSSQRRRPANSRQNHMRR